MKLTLSRQVLEWINNEVFPIMIAMCSTRLQLYNSKDVEYMNLLIVEFCLQSTIKKFLKKRSAKKLVLTVTLEDAEALTLYRFLFNYPIHESEIWKISQRQFLINQINKNIQL